MRARFLIWGLLGLALLVTEVGCNSKGSLHKVQGVVTLDGKPVGAGAAINFIPIGGSGQPANGVTKEDGTFELTTVRAGDGIQAGEYKVTVIKSPGAGAGPAGAPPAGKGDGGGPPPGQGGAPGAEGKGGGGGMGKVMPKEGGGPPPIESSLPMKYADPEKTPLKIKIPHSGKIELKLES